MTFSQNSRSKIKAFVFVASAFYVTLMFTLVGLILIADGANYMIPGVIIRGYLCLALITVILVAALSNNAYLFIACSTVHYKVLVTQILVVITATGKAFK